jgi:hypothetical protein
MGKEGKSKARDVYSPDDTSNPYQDLPAFRLPNLDPSIPGMRQ